MLFFEFARDELHVRLHERCADRFSVVAVVLLMLDERLHILWRDDFAVEGRDNHPIKWRAKYGGMDGSMIAKTKALEDGNRRPKKMFADLSMQNELLKGALGKK